MTNYSEWLSNLTFTVNATNTGNGGANRDISISLQYNNGTSWVSFGSLTIPNRGGTSGSTSVNLSQASGSVTQATVNYFAALNGAPVQFRAVSTNPALTSQTSNFTFDTVAPSAPSISGVADDVGSVQGPVANGSSGNDTTPTVTVSLAGTGAAVGNVVKLLSNGVEVGSVTLTQAQVTSGSVSIASPTLTGDGLRTFTATVTDSAANTSPVSGSWSYRLDTTADASSDASLTVDTTADGVVSNAEATALKLTLSGIDADAATVKIDFTYGGNTVSKTLAKIGGTTFNGEHTVDLSDLPFGAQGNVSTSMTVTDAAGNVLSKSGTTFQGVICFFPGTLIATPEGERAVETLARGDLVLTAEGKAVPVRWVGRQTVATRFADPLRALPVRIRAGALGDNLPKRDLLVSPGHALLVDGILATAAALVNGTSILRESAVPEIFTYFHVELADQSLILAEGAPAETFLDDAERSAFDNWAEHEAAHDGAPVRELDLPRATSQRQLPAATRQRLAAIAARLCGTVAAAA